ncbi:MULTISPECIES: hypothetical protein [Stutzerimonas stutzeri group]|uniref:Uncharacterized protein n=1 Tax=Stutzerimonas frequens TaxID=2968969 RepID=A0ABX6XUU7_9GAMM|nr:MULTISPECIES: hypothetical protein [Stutzerimonas stutzeri group]MBA1227937.1 hypothetical protein [Stutzerimonas stutzeri]MCQ4306307.1 hypothetical protein [Stutzerimonas frequens]QPT17830.1 hypothetical protein I6G34_00195 [Stutzerimonas frequens]
MKAPLLSVDKIEFEKISVEVNPEFDGEYSSELKKVNFNYKGSRFFRSVSLSYPDDQLADPRFFSFTLNLVLSQDNQKSEIILPYSIDVKATAYMRYDGEKHKNVELFRAVRATGYAILYGSIREMISNLTARGPHGLWMLPAADFNSAAQEEAQQDEMDRQKAIAERQPLDCLSDSVEDKPKRSSATKKGKASKNPLE